MPAARLDDAEAHEEERELTFTQLLLLTLDILWICLLIPPYLLLELLWMLFPQPGKSLKDKVILVTGGGRGFGRALAEGLAKEGGRVAVADINLSTARETAATIVNSGGIAKAYAVDVASVQEVRQLHTSVSSDLGVVDILINNAGLVHGQTLDKCSHQTIQTIINVNLTSHFWTIKEFLPDMKDRNSGHIVAIASIASMANSSGNVAPYVATKFGISGMMGCLRSELDERPNNNIRTTTVYPYFMNINRENLNRIKTRYPPIPLDLAVKETIAGIRRDQVSITIPRGAYFLVNFFRLLPQPLYDKAFKVFYTKYTPMTDEAEARLMSSTSRTRL